MGYIMGYLCILTGHKSIVLTNMTKENVVNFDCWNHGERFQVLVSTSIILGGLFTMDWTLEPGIYVVPSWLVSSQGVTPSLMDIFDLGCKHITQKNN